MINFTTICCTWLPNIETFFLFVSTENGKKKLLLNTKYNQISFM